MYYKFTHTEYIVPSTQTKFIGLLSLENLMVFLILKFYDNLTLIPITVEKRFLFVVSKINRPS